MRDNIVALFITVSVSMLLVSCASAPTVTERVRIGLPACVLEMADPADACQVQVFDGASLDDAQRNAQGQWYIDVPKDTVTAARIAFYMAAGYEPQVFAIKMLAVENEHVALGRMADKSGGFIAGLLYRKTEPRMDGICGIESFIGQEEVSVVRARERFALMTDNLGHFQIYVPAGRFTVQAGEHEREVEVRQGDTIVVLIDIE